MMYRSLECCQSTQMKSTWLRANYQGVFGIVAYVLKCDIVVKMFTLQSHYYIDFGLIPLGKAWIPSNGLKVDMSLIKETKSNKFSRLVEQ